MGEAKRRKELLGEKYGQEKSNKFFGLSLPEKPTEQFMKLTTRATWIGIGSVAAFWLTVRFLGPSLGWWHVD
jgi:Protein of unknown function (DUF2839)